MKVIGYIRVSTEEQASGGISLEAQAEKIRVYCKLYDLELIEVIQDAGESAKSLKRPGMQRILEIFETGHHPRGCLDGIVVAKLDRLTRSMRDLSYLLETYFESRFILFSVSENLNPKTAAGRLVLNVLASVAQWEREVISERTSAALQHLKSMGKYVGGHVPFGFRKDGSDLIPDSHEQEMIAIARHLKDDGLSLRKIGSVLSEMGYDPRLGGEWSAQQVKSILAHNYRRAKK